MTNTVVPPLLWWFKLNSVNAKSNIVAELSIFAFGQNAPKRNLPRIVNMGSDHFYFWPSS
jgi:hypothetical protein